MLYDAYKKTVKLHAILIFAHYKRDHKRLLQNSVPTVLAKNLGLHGRHRSVP
jgi:hypothetical protein